MRFYQWVVIACLFSLSPQRLSASPAPQPATEASTLKLAVELSYEASKKRLFMKGELTYQLPSQAPPPSELCFYLPYNDPRPPADYEPLRHLERYIQRDAPKASNPKQATRLRPMPPHAQTWQAVEWLGPQVVKLSAFTSSLPSASISLHFDSYLSASLEGDTLLHGFYPLPLSQCPKATFEPEEILPLLATLAIHARVTHQLADQQLVGPGRQETETLGKQQEFRIFARKIAFLLAKPFRELHFELSDGVQVSAYLQSSPSGTFIETLKRAYASHRQWFGTFPYSQLTVVESEVFHKADLAGLIIINQARQFLFNYMQESLLNWKHWVLSTLLAAQWFGGAITVSQPRDYWLLAGLCDFATLMFLRSYGLRFNLFNHYDDDFQLLSFNYLQIQDLTASFLLREKPLTALTDTHLRSLESLQAQSPLLFIKQSIALRFLRATIGSRPLQEVLSAFTRQSLYQSVSPAQLYEAFLLHPRQASAASRQRNASYLKTWWVQAGWPDYGVASFQKKKLSNGKWLAELSMHSKGQVVLPTQCRFEDQSGQFYLVTAQPIADPKRPVKISAVTELEPIDATIDPFYHLFDSNRFDNHTSGPELTVFPLGTNTLSDHAYTSVWVPYLFRRPGEGPSLAVQAAVLEYLRSGLFAKVEFSPRDRKAALHARLEFKPPQSANSWQLGLTHNYDNYRTAEISFMRKPAISELAAIDLDSSLRYRLISGQKHSGHPTLGLGLTLNKQNLIGDTCGLSLQAHSEHAPPWQKEGFHYTRYKGKATLDCALVPNVNYVLRHFRGLLVSQAAVSPKHAYFRVNQLDEAGIRVDAADLPLLSQVYGFNQELLLPLRLPLKQSSLLLSQKLKLRFTYDLGFTSWQKPRTAYEAAGAGVLLPFGGDVVGMGSLTLSRLSLLTIFYMRRDQAISHKPHLLFDLSGEL